MIEIKHHITGVVLHTIDAETLSGMDLSGADLSGANLISADLRGASMHGALIRGTNLIWAKINDIQLSDLAESLGMDTYKVIP
jgi:uncharacterized protein YjbI with pentapeptide repeats